MTIYGTTPDGLDFELFTLSRGDLTVQITNYGARLLRVVRDGVDLLYGPKSPEELLADDCYCGAVCGRVANRIAGGSFELDGRRYQLAVNNGPNHLHGGTIGFNARIWSVEQADESRLVLTLLSPDGEEGYPGTVRVRAVYSLGEQGLSLDLEADTDAPTLLNLTNHAYWNLSGSCKRPVNNHVCLYSSLNPETLYRVGFLSGWRKHGRFSSVR